MTEKDTKETIISPDYYEVGYHVMSTLSEDEAAVEASRVRKCVEEAGGVVAKEQLPQRMPLAYTIERRRGGSRETHDAAYFGWMVFEGSGDVAEKVNTSLRATDTLIRFLIIHTHKEEPIPTKPRSVFKRPPHEPERAPEKKPVTETPLSTEELDKEIEKLVSSE